METYADERERLRQIVAQIRETRKVPLWISRRNIETVRNYFFEELDSPDDVR